MASFVEQATLQLRDQSTKQINQINAALKRLFATTRKMRSMKIDLGLRSRDIQRAQQQVTRLASTVQRLNRQTTLRLNSSAIDNALTKAARLQHILRSMSGRVALPATGGGVRPTPPVARPGVTPPLNVNVAPLRVLLNGFIYRLGYTIENAIITGFARGTQDLDVARTRLRLQELTPAQMATASATADAIAGEFRTMSRGQALGMVSETLPIARGNLDVAGQITSQLAGIVELQTALGQTSEQASDSAFLFAKAAEQMGVFSDASGNFDAKAAKSFFDTVKRGQIEIGRELTPELIRGLVKSSRTAKFGFDAEGFLAAMFLAEEMGTSAGVGINQLIKQLTGERIQKKQLARLQELGLITEAEVRTGRVGEEAVTERISGGAVDDEGLRRNFLKWIREQVIPVAQREGVDVTNAAQVSRFAGTITSDRTATDTLTAAIVRAAELQLQIQRAMERDVSDARIREITGESLSTATQEAITQLQSVLGEVGNSFRTILVPALKTVGEVAHDIASFISGGTGEGSIARSAAAVGGAGVLAGGGLLAGRAALGLLNPFSRSAVQLTTAGVQLQAAAAALTRAAGVQAAGGAAGGAAGKAARGMGLLGALGAAGALATLASLIRPAADKVREQHGGRSTTEPRGTVAEWLAKVAPQLFREASENRENAVARAIREAHTDFKERTELRDRTEPPAPKAVLTDEMRQVLNMQKLMQQDRELAAARAINANPVLEDRATRERGQSETINTFLTGMDASLATASAEFSTTFATGSQQFAATASGAAPGWGSSMGATFGAMIPGFGASMGAAFGEAAASRIRAAVANLNVNVNARVNQVSGGVDTGGQAPNE